MTTPTAHELEQKRERLRRFIPGEVEQSIVGNGTCPSFFDFPHVPRLRRRAPGGVGGVMHVALPISQDHLEAVRERLDTRRVKYQEVGRSLYLKDPNGLGIELMPARQP